MHTQTEQRPPLKIIQQINPSITIIRLPDVAALTGLSRSSVYKLLKADQAFPRPVPLSASKARGAPIGFVLAEVQAWIAAQIAKRDQGVSA